jgi:hypothetical protein
MFAGIKCHGTGYALNQELMSVGLIFNSFCTPYSYHLFSSTCPILVIRILNRKERFGSTNGLATYDMLNLGLGISKEHWLEVGIRGSYPSTSLEI